VNAGPDQTVSHPNPATLQGQASDDGLPSGTLTIAWTKDSGPGTVTFVNTSDPQTTATFSAAGTYVLRLAANDTQYDSYDTVIVTVNPDSNTTWDLQNYCRVDPFNPAMLTAA
jgi:hypothetical protein